MSSSKASHSTSARTRLALAILFILSVALYSPGAHGPYLIDDHPNLLGNRALHFEQLSMRNLYEAMFTYPSGPTYRPLAMASFALNYYFAGNRDSFSIKASNILLHACIALAIFLFTRRLLRRLHPAGGEQDPRVIPADWLALFIAAIWALHPLHVSTVLYAVQRMAQLSTLFCILGTYAYVCGREQWLNGVPRGKWLAAGGLVFGTVLAVFSKENGALLPLLLLIVESIFFRFAHHPRTPLRDRHLLKAALLLPSLAILIFLGYEAAQSWQYRPLKSFSFSERIMTEARVLFHYLGLLFWPDIRHMGMFPDYIATSRSLLDPWTTLPAILGLLGMTGLALLDLAHRRRLVLSFGILWFLAGHLLESTVLQLELVFEHRNYLPSYGLMFAAGFYFGRFHWLPASSGRLIRVALLCGIMALLAGQLFERSRHWSSLPSFAVHEVLHHPRSALTMYHLGYAYSSHGQHQESLYYFERAAALDPGEIAYAIQAAIMRYALHQSDPSLLEHIAQRLQHGKPSAFALRQLIYLANMSLRNDWQNDETLERLLAAALSQSRFQGSRIHAEVSYAHGFVLQQLQRPAAALAAYRQAIASQPRGPKVDELRLRITGLLLGMERLAEARTELGRIDVEGLSPVQVATLNRYREQLTPGLSPQKKAPASAGAL